MNTLAAPAQSLLHRYPGIRPFKQEEDYLFFGRTTEINELLHSLKVHDVFVLFSKSGLGKSSLINAGLSQKLLKEKMYPINIRFLDSNDYPIEKVAEQVKKIIPRERLKNIPEAFQNNLWLLLSMWDNPDIPILLFDQFEEFFYYPPNVRAEAISEIADSIETKIPLSLKEKIDKNDDLVESKKIELLDQLEKLSIEKAAKPMVKLVFAIRSDRLSQLDEVSKKIPGIFSNRYQLKPLKKARAEQAIALPAQLRQKGGKMFRSTAYEYSIESLRIILEAISNKQDEVESTQLQIVCGELESIAIAKNKGGADYMIIEPEDFGGKEGIQKILNKFYEDQLEKLRTDEELLLQDEDMKAIRHLIEDELLSNSNKRISQHADRVKGLLTGVKQDVTFISGVQKEEAIINKLLELRLLREDDSHLGKVYEISHDTLVESIIIARDKRKKEGRNTLNEQLIAEKEVTVDMLSNVKENKYCYVVMGFGKKTDFETGRVLDLDKSYKNMIKPAVEAAGLRCVRADEIIHHGIIDMPLYEQLLSADVVVADLSTSNRNAVYELGIRHALRPFTTIVVAEDGIKYFPFDINHVAVRQYHHLGEDVSFDEVLRFRKVLTQAIRNMLSKYPRDIDSPVYTVLNYLRPPSLSAHAVNNVVFNIENKLESAKTERKDWNTGTETHSMLMQQVDEAQKRGDWITAKTLLSLIRQMKKDDLKNLQKELVDSSEDPYILQRLAFLTYKSKLPNEKDALLEARELLIRLNPNTTNDTETLGLWGTVQKRLWELTKNIEFLNETIKAYQKGFLFRNDYYNGITYAFMLNVRAAQSIDLAEAIADFVDARRVREEVLLVCQQWLQENPMPEKNQASENAIIEYYKNWYWLMAAMAEAYVGVGDEAKAEEVVGEANAKAPDVWMQASTAEQINKLHQLLKDSPLQFIMKRQ